MTNAKGPSRAGDAERAETLVDLPDTSITPEQGAQVKGGGRLEYPNLASVQSTSSASLKYETEVTDYNAKR